MKRNVFVACMPKAGTHLIVRIAQHLLGRKLHTFGKQHVGFYPAIAELVDGLDYRDFAFFGHIRHRNLPQIAASPAWTVLVLIRDPRDVVLSMRDYLDKSTNPHHLEAFSTISHLSRSDQIKAIISGIRVRKFSVAAVSDHCSGWLEWVDKGATLIRYEDLLDGSAARPLARALGKNEAAAAAAIAAAVGRPNITLNVGRANRWRDEMDEEVLRHFRAHEDGIVERLGYSW